MGQHLFKSTTDNTYSDIQLSDEEKLYFEYIINPEHLDWRNGKKNEEEEILLISKKQANMPVQINGYLYLSNAGNAHKIEKLKERGITHVLNVAGPSAKISDETKYAKNNITALNIDADDEEGYPMIKRHLKECQTFVNKCRQVKKGKIVIHCHAGINRSGVIMAAIYMLNENKNILDVVKHLRLCRGNACLWNESFVQQLIKLAASKGLLGPKPNLNNNTTSKTNYTAAKTGKSKFNSEKLKLLFG
jgi:predicted protein tyrosine phosphatase